MSNDTAIALLRSIDASLKTLIRQSAGQTGADVADDRDLDGKYGDPEVRFNPRDWTGDSCKGLRMSECPPAFLDLLAETFDYFARKAEETGEEYNGKPVAPYKRKDAARARGWAKRLRAGYRPPQQPEFNEPEPSPAPGFDDTATWPEDDLIPF